MCINRTTHGGVGARESAAREADLFGIFCWQSTKNARRLTGHDIARRQLRHSHAVRAGARAFTPDLLTYVHAWTIHETEQFLNWQISIGQLTESLYSSCSPDPVISGYPTQK